MGCFLGCFGGSKDRKRRKQRNKVIPRNQQRLEGLCTLQTAVVTEQGIRESPPSNSHSEFIDKPEKPEEQLISSTRKIVTFDSNIKTYDRVSLTESTESVPESKKVVEEEEILVESSKSQSIAEDDSVTSSVGSYPPNHRYQNCRDSDDEADECGDSDLDDVDDNEEDYSDYNDEGDGRFVSQEVWPDSCLTESLESRTEHACARVIVEEVESPMLMSIFPDQEVKTTKLKGNARDRSDYVYPVLNPVENLTQWKTVKSKGTSPLKPKEENFTADLEALHISFTSEPTFKHSLSHSKSKSNQSKNSNQEAAVDASLSTWLVSPESTPIRTSLSTVGTVTSEKATMPQGSNSVRSLEDRPILGALTVEELKQLSASSSPRRSPSRSPDEMPIIGTVGTYWNDSVPRKDSRSASSCKGIPNTTSKYREDKRVKWHSTPFETRLERALNRGGDGEA